MKEVEGSEMEQLMRHLYVELAYIQVSEIMDRLQWEDKEDQFKKYWEETVIDEF